MKYTEKEKDILRDIGYFYLEKNQREMTRDFPYLSDDELLNISEEKKMEYNIAWDKTYIDTERQLIQLGITGCSFDELTSKITLQLARPGFLIGERGKNIEALGEYLKKQIDNSSIKIKVEEDNIMGYLIPIDPKQYDEEW